MHYTSNRHRHVLKFTAMRWSHVIQHVFLFSISACHCTPRLRECTAIRPSADNAAAFATCAKQRSPLVSRTRKYDHITPVLQHLHWLPICVRPTYKVLMVVYSDMHEQAPCYLAELLSRRQPNRRLWKHRPVIKAE